MKKIDFYLLLLLALILSFSLFGLKSNKVIGQITLPGVSSGSSGCPQVQTDCAGEPPGCESSFGIYDPKTCMCICQSSSGSGSLTCNSESDCPLGVCPDGKTYQNYSCLDGKCYQLNFFADPCLFSYSSSSSGLAPVSLSNNFTGVWKGRVKRSLATNSSSLGECIICTQVIPVCNEGQTIVQQTCNECAHCSNTSGGMVSNISRKTLNHISNEAFGSSIIILKLCVKDGKLSGTVQQGGVFINGIITSQTIISKNEVEITAESKDGTIAEIKLKLTGKRQLVGTFTDGHTFEAKKINSFLNCKSSSSSSSSSGGGFENCGSKASCRGPNGTYLPCPSGTECSGLPAYGCYPPGCPVPICCSPDTKIRTDGIQKRIADIRIGDKVITSGEKLVRVKKTSKVEVKNHNILRVRLNDGIVLEISPNHPTADGRTFKDLKIGDRLDGRLVVETKLIPYNYMFTYDILPDSETGDYYANGVLIGSTLKYSK
ncbi:MAG: hypothetical protein HY094_06740 [Candidatus Melainabacteria bacterium]|nr:hypothetical protein [Candidatus Melainabacteria bacterium]